ncbi:MAG: DUF4920 domain-containing protein [Polyangiaceae bacterium]
MILSTSRLAGFVLLCGLIGCKAQHADPPAALSAPAVQSSAAQPLAVKTFGAPISAGPVLSLADVLATPDRFRGQSITVEGHVRAACTRRGCWMEMAQGAAPNLPGCRVTFKDYGFFVPTDSAGSPVKVQGTFAVDTLAPERVAHLESEGGLFPHKNADGSVNELKLVANGVELWR